MSQRRNVQHEALLEIKVTVTVNVKDEIWMGRALELARQAGAEGEVPVGAILVRDGMILGEGWNRPITLCDPTAHAEILALRAAAQSVGNYRLPGVTIYSTLEPCPMCAGAMVHARLARLVFGTHDLRSGAVVSQFDLLQSATLNHRVAWEVGVLQEECATLLREFFRSRR
ncbi:tRNA adenosine(34) deaminase [Gammaproteobacteria bacterium]